MAGAATTREEGYVSPVNGSRAGVVSGSAPLARELLVALGLLAGIVLVGLVDIATPLYGFSLFYLIPIAIGAWTLSARAAAVLAAAAALMWSFADLLDKAPDTAIATGWNGFTRLVIFMSFALLIGLLRQRERQSADLETFRGEILELIDNQVPGRLERVRRLTASAAARDRDAPAELITAVDDLILMTHTVVALSIMASGPGATVSDVPAVVGECVRSAGARERVVVAVLPSASAGIDPRLLRFLVSGVLVAALRATNGYVRVAIRARDGRVVIAYEIDAPTRERSAGNVADLLLAIGTARAVLARFGGTVSVQEQDGASGVEIELPEVSVQRA